MTGHLDCQWIEKNLEALFCGRLDAEQGRLARAHIETCSSCSQEVQALDAIDPLIKKHFREEMKRAQRPRVAHVGRLAGLSAATVAIIVLLLFVSLARAPQTSPAASDPSAAVAPPTAAAPVQSPGPVKNSDTATSVERVKPVNAPSKISDQPFRAEPAASENSPDFLVKDQAGYSRRADDFRGHFALITVWSAASAEAVSNFERLYKAHGAEAKFRFVGVSNERLSKPANTTFPVFYNQGSKLFGLKSGEFVLLDENGGIAMRGSLTKDFDTLQKALAQK